MSSHPSMTSGHVGSRGAGCGWHLKGHDDIGMAGASISGSTALGDAAQAAGSFGAMSPGLSSPYLPGYTNFLSPPTNWRQVENEAESACL
jgi:hypothetical protein